MEQNDMIDKAKKSSIKMELNTESTDDNGQQIFLKIKKNLLLSLAIFEILDSFMIGLQEGVAVSRICWLALNLCILFFVMYRTWKAGVLLWIFKVPMALNYIIYWRGLLLQFSFDNPILSIRIILALSSSLVVMFTVVWLTLIPKNRRYSKNCR